MTRKTLLKLHRWIGLAFAALLLVQALSGTAMVFRDELEPLVHPELEVSGGGARAPLQELVDTVRAAAPDAKLLRFEWSRGGAVLFRLLDANGEPMLMALDPRSGTILRQGGLGTWPTEWLFHLHDALLSGKVGEWIVGLGGIALIFIVITGPIVWWPGRKRLKTGFRVIRGAGADRLLRSLHRAAGAALALVILISAGTGVTMIFKPNLQPLLMSADAYVPKPMVDVPEKPAGSERLSVDTLIAKARHDYGPSELMEVRFQGEAAQVVLVYLRDEASARENASKQIYFNAYDGSEVGHYVPSALPAGNSFIDWQYPIHTGRQAGPLGRLLILLGGVGLIFFTVSGAWLWLSSRRQRRAREEKRTARLLAEGRG